MNRERRKSLQAVIERLHEIGAEIEAIQSEEQEYLDAMPEAIQAGDKGDAADQAITYLGEALDQVTEAVTALEDAAT